MGRVMITGLIGVLLQQAMKKAKDLGYENLYLWTPDQQALYQKYGFKEIELFDYLTYKQASLMKLTL